MTSEEIIDGLKFTVDMFLFDPTTGETYKEPQNNMDKTTIDACKGAIELLEQTRWIPIGERLPEGFEPVLFTSKNGEIAIGYRDPRFKTYWACIDRADWHHTDFDVIAWTPLPEPYQEGEKNEHD